MGLKNQIKVLKRQKKLKTPFKPRDQPSVRATRSQRREARVRPVYSRTRLAFCRKTMAATSFDEDAAYSRF